MLKMPLFELSAENAAAATRNNIIIYALLIRAATTFLIMCMTL